MHKTVLLDRASGATRDLLVMGYLSAVADAVERRGVAESRIRMGDPDRDLLHGSLDLGPVAAPDGPARSRPLSLAWDEENGWSARLQTRTRDETARRFLHPELVAAPCAVSGFIAGLAAGRDVGMLYPATCVTAGDARERRMLDLARYAIPEVRRWLGTQP
jgi:hypothetical protein